ncbi:serine/threonine-protein kinase [Clostridium sp. JS66]|uniref:serine/threonine-protein kinase n=1 Tax=Clostridium sp. JS66 TaxID=3064705 RepID=UPI00298D7ECC|nr:serine/threonine-protein kinase [Clostridium sp. JS66]WPC44669.1 serine/threonine-protein kinase [Clostridium sp. JS66]
MELCYTQLKFDLLEAIGQEGKNSTVYKAFDSQLNENLIVKKISKKAINEDYNNTDESNFFNESRLLNDVKHPNVMPIKYASEDEQYIYISMPYYKNGSLNNLLNKKFLTVKEIIKYSLEFLSGVHYIHTKGLIHFDIKPTNIMIDDNNKAVITDFGLAKYIDSYGLARPNKLYNLHMPPEVNKYTDFSNKADIYQSGITLYRMCNGNKVFHSMFKYWNTKGQARQAITEGNFPNRKFYLPHIPIKLRKIINKALNINVDERYETILDMINEISSIEIDANWIYNTKENNCLQRWYTFNKKGTHFDTIELVNKGSGIYDVYGKRIRLNDNDVARIRNWDLINVKITDAFKKIETIIKNY